MGDAPRHEYLRKNAAGRCLLFSRRRKFPTEPCGGGDKILRGLLDDVLRYLISVECGVAYLLRKSGDD